MAGPTLAIREQCPVATVDNDGLMSAAQVVQLNIVAQGVVLGARYTVTAADVLAGGDVLTVPLDSAQANTNYAAYAFVAAGDSTITAQVPISGRAVAQVQVLLSAPLAEGDIVEVFVMR